MHDLARRQPPGLQLLSNGRYTVMLTGSGAGYSHWGNCAITRWHADPTRDDNGCWLYLRDLDDGTAWSAGLQPVGGAPDERSEEHTSELKSLMRNSYAGFCLKKKKQHKHQIIK